MRNSMVAVAIGRTATDRMWSGCRRSSARRGRPAFGTLAGFDGLAGALARGGWLGVVPRGQLRWAPVVRRGSAGPGQPAVGLVRVGRPGARGSAPGHRVRAVGRGAAGPGLAGWAGAVRELSAAGPGRARRRSLVAAGGDLSGLSAEFRGLRRRRVGDLPGITGRLGYLARLPLDPSLLSPFY